MNPEDVKIGMKVLYLEEVWEVLKWPHYVTMRDTPYGMLGDDNYREGNPSGVLVKGKKTTTTKAHCLSPAPTKEEMRKKTYEEQKASGLPHFVMGIWRDEFVMDNDPEAYAILLKHCFSVGAVAEVHSPPTDREETIRELAELRPELENHEAYVKDGKAQGEVREGSHSCKFNLHNIPSAAYLPENLNERLKANLNHVGREGIFDLASFGIDSQALVKQLVKDGITLKNWEAQ